MDKKTAILKVSLGVAFMVFFLWTFFSYVPFNMDELCSYHVIACNEYPLNKLNVFRERCDACDLSVLKGPFVPLLTYSYVGSSAAAVYYPLFKLWRSPYSIRFLGLLFLAAQAFLLYKIFRLDLFFCFFFLLLFFPYAFQHMVDFGPKLLQTTSIFLVLYLSRQWRLAAEAGSGSSWKYPACIGALIFLGVWTKLAYFLVVPSILVLVAYTLFEGRGMRAFDLKQFKRGWLFLVLTAIVPSYILLNGVNRWGAKYAKIAENGKFVPLFDLAGLRDHFIALSKFFTNPLQSAHVVFEVKETATFAGIFFLVLMAGFFCFAVWRMFSSGKRVAFVVLNIALFFVALILMAYNQNVWAMHHVALAFPFLLLALFDIFSQCYKDKAMKIFLAVFICSNLFFYGALTQEKPFANSYPGLVRFNEFLSKGYSRDHVFVVIDWGMYYLKSLYGEKDQCVIYIDPFTEKDVPALKKILETTNRRPMFIGRKDSFYTRGIAGHFTEVTPGFDVGPWAAWH